MENIKPLSKSRDLPLLVSIRGLALSQIGEQALLSNPAIDNEGEVEWDDGVWMYRGTTLLKIELTDSAAGFAGVDKDKLVQAVSRSLRFRVRLMRLARREAERRVSPKLLTGMAIDTEFSIERNRLLVDINVECPLASPITEVGEKGEALV